jgi:hypothetical protein
VSGLHAASLNAISEDVNVGGVVQQLVPMPVITEGETAMCAVASRRYTLKPEPYSEPTIRNPEPGTQKLEIQEHEI